ncbi:hypothetical protein OXE08_004513 [Salmonella enterica]|nr:hypothetical protein [Salmonella enterica]
MNQSNLIPGHGRNPGSQNRETRRRNEAFRKKLDETNIIFKLLDEIANDINEGGIKFKEKVEALAKLAPYYVNTVKDEDVIEQIAAITSAEEAEKAMALLTAKLKSVKG